MNDICLTLNVTDTNNSKKKGNEQNKRSYDGLYIKTYNTNRNNNYIKS